MGTTKGYATQSQAFKLLFKIPNLGIICIFVFYESFFKKCVERFLEEA